MTNSTDGIADKLKSIGEDFEEFQEEVRANQKLILESAQKRFRKARALEDGGHENVCVWWANAQPGSGQIVHGERGVIGEYSRDEDGLFTGRVTLEFNRYRRLDLLIWASNLVYATEEEGKQD